HWLSSAFKEDPTLAKRITLFDRIIDREPLSEVLIKVFTTDFAKKDQDERVAHGVGKGVTAEYRQPSRALRHFKEFFEEKILKAYNINRNAFYALYFAVVQSSGYGKTRLLLEAGKRFFNLVYCCLRDPKSTGYPLRNDRLADYLKSHNDE